MNEKKRGSHYFEENLLNAIMGTCQIKRIRYCLNLEIRPNGSIPLPPPPSSLPPLFVPVPLPPPLGHRNLRSCYV